MLGRSSRGSRITGGTGPSSEDVTVSTFGQMLLRWSSPMAPMAGSASSWMESWPPCTPVEVQRVDQTVLVQMKPNAEVHSGGIPSGFLPVIDITYF